MICQELNDLPQRSGDKTPADLILFAASDLKVDNSSLTGESEPQERLARPDGVQQRPVEAENLVRTVAWPRGAWQALIPFSVIQLHIGSKRRRLGW